MNLIAYRLNNNNNKMIRYQTLGCFSLNGMFSLIKSCFSWSKSTGLVTILIEND